MATTPWSSMEVGPLTVRERDNPALMAEREMILNQRLLDIYYGRLHDRTVREARRLQCVGGTEYQERVEEPYPGAAYVLLLLSGGLQPPERSEESQHQNEWDGSPAQPAGERDDCAPAGGNAAAVFD